MSRHLYSCLAWLLAVMAPLLFVPTLAQDIPNDGQQSLYARKASEVMHIDGVADEASWQSAPWYAIDNLLAGTMPSKDDFSGRFKLLWQAQQLFILAEIKDDVLFDQYASPLTRYWDDDCLEVFVDEDASGGDHQFNFNAFAYHVALDNQVVDLGEKQAGRKSHAILLNEHINSRWRIDDSKDNTVIWELAVSIFDDSFSYPTNKQTPVTLTLGKSMGFMLAYCDNDASQEREHFVGSARVESVNGNSNLGYITADVFQPLYLIE